METIIIVFLLSVVGSIMLATSLRGESPLKFLLLIGAIVMNFACMVIILVLHELTATILFSAAILLISYFVPLRLTVRRNIPASLGVMALGVAFGLAFLPAIGEWYYLLFPFVGIIVGVSLTWFWSLRSALV